MVGIIRASAFFTQCVCFGLFIFFCLSNGLIGFETLASSIVLLQLLAPTFNSHRKQIQNIPELEYGFYRTFYFYRFVIKLNKPQLVKDVIVQLNLVNKVNLKK